jgi:murein DD-endopeptidase MepM/ murein hydrolase activator NlpD
MALAVFLAFGAVAAASPTPTPDPTEEARLNGIFQRFDAKRDVVESKLRSIELQLIDIEARLTKLRAKLAASEREMQKRQGELAAAIKSLADQKLLLKDSAASIYMRGPWSYLNAVLNAEDIGSILRVEVYSEAVLGDFVRIMHDLQGKKEKVEQLYNTVRKRTLDLRTQTREVEAEESHAMQLQQQQFAQNQRLINALVADFGGLDALRAHGFDVILRSYSGGSTRITNDLKEAQQGQDVAQDGEYILRWPVEEHRITSRFGWRIHPIFGYRSFHTGIDIGSDYGSELVASMAGRIVDVGYMGAYGLAIVIDHGHSLATVYAHLSRALVSIGENVTAGQQIGTVGCSGWCTGPHVHYEVRVASEARNPVFWL